ncbi:MAG: iron-sulfur cluster assembly protein [Candidatus Latescibacterota bacterium]
MSESTYAERSDSIEDKLAWLRAAYENGRHDLALSLADSIRQTLRCERQEAGPDDALLDGAEGLTAVADLPGAWRDWARGWRFCRGLRLSEEAGLARRGEPVEVGLALADGQADDPRREVRVARVEAGALRQVPSQVHGERRSGGRLHCRLVFPADVGVGTSQRYVVFFGNPWAERPQYVTDLRVQGEGYALQVDNEHFRACLSAQTGQLERLVYRRAHGLELFAGGEGHGEPPHIDWAHDYLAAGQFQKFRVTNWAQVPDWEVVRGPLMVEVRRWGFPHGPAHPLFTPSRLHIDVAYRFYAGLPVFFKRGRMEAVHDVEIDYLRDDEWVFSGYSFTHAVWMDRGGRLHEGPVAPGQANDLWGVGFYNDRSRDAFIVLWLEHGAEGFDGVVHCGAPQLDYQGHGQLWSRWAAQGRPSFRAGAVLRQWNAYLTAPYEGPESVERTRQQLLQPLRVAAEKAGAGAGLSAPGALARPGETEETAGPKANVWEALRQVRDDMFYTADANVVDMGYVYDVQARDGVVRVLMTMPHRGRPRHRYLGRPMRERLLGLPGVAEAVVDFTWEPPWSLARITPAGRRAMGLG